MHSYLADEWVAVPRPSETNQSSHNNNSTNSNTTTAVPSTTSALPVATNATPVGPMRNNHNSGGSAQQPQQYRMQQPSSHISDMTNDLARMSTNEQMEMAMRLSAEAYQARQVAAAQPASRLGRTSSSAASAQQILERKSDAELAALLTDEAKLANLLVELPQVVQVQCVRNDLMRGNAELAKKNLAFDDKVKDLRNQINIVRSSEFSAASEAYDEVRKDYVAARKLADPDAIAAALRKALQVDETASEELVDRFQRGDGSMDTRTFVREYMELRRRYHTRELKRQAIVDL